MQSTGVDLSRASGVDEKEVVVVENGVEEGEVGVPCPGRRVTGPTLDRGDRAGRRRCGGASRVQLEPDGECVALGIGVDHRYLDRTAPRAGEVVARVERHRSQRERGVRIESASGRRRGGILDIRTQSREGDDGDVALVDDVAASLATRTAAMAMAATAAVRISRRRPTQAMVRAGGGR